MHDTHDMRQKFFVLRSRAALLAGAAVFAGAVSVSSVVPAFALDDGQESVFDTVLGLIAMSPSKEKVEIDYREHPPLVLPPNMELRPPQQPGAARTADWPQDPDVVRRKKAAAEVSRAKNSTAKGNDLLSKQELLAGRVASGEVAAPPQHCGEHEHWCLYVNPDQLRAQGMKTENTSVAVGEEPEREYLTQPPKGYRVATKKVQATFEPREKDDSADPRAYFRKQANPDPQ